MTTPPDRDHNPPPKRQPASQEGDSLLDDVVDEVVDPFISRINLGCLLRLVLLPLRLVWNIIEAIFD